MRRSKSVWDNPNFRGKKIVRIRLGGEVRLEIVSVQIRWLIDNLVGAKILDDGNGRILHKTGIAAEPYELRLLIPEFLDDLE